MKITHAVVHADLNATLHAVVHIYRILCISGRGYYFFVRQKTLYNWVSAALISGAATIRFKEMNIYAMEIFPNRVFALL